MSHRARPRDTIVSVEFTADFSLDDVRAQIDHILAEYEGRTPRGIEISNSIEQMGFETEYREIQVAMDPDLYPTSAIRVIFLPGD